MDRLEALHRGSVQFVHLVQIESPYMGTEKMEHLLRRFVFPAYKGGVEGVDKLDKVDRLMQ